MARSLGLTAYRALARRGDVIPHVPVASRPSGELLWLHAAEVGSTVAVTDLAIRIASAREGLNILITTRQEQSEGRKTRELPNGRLMHEFIPNEHPGTVAQFLDHWQPDCCVWCWGGLRPNVILEAADRGCPMFLIDVDVAGLESRRDRWLPELTRGVLGEFSVVLARSESAAHRLLQLGLSSDDVEITQALMAGGHALPARDEDVSALSAALVGRPVWFANAVVPEELPVVLSAHRQALRLAHRLLLIIRPSGDLTTDAAMEQAQEENFRVQNWLVDPELNDSVQVLVAEDETDVGLFYRVAPISFLGSSLVSGHRGCDPFEPAALGSAVLYGPKVGRFLSSYSRLASVGAARIVNDAAALGTAITRLVAPDQAAAMAHGGWEVISQGAALADKVTDLVQDALDLGPVRN